MDRFKFLAWGSWSEYRRFYEGMRNAIERGQSDLALRQKLLQFIRRNDSRRGHKFEEIFPEYASFFSY